MRPIGLLIGCLIALLLTSQPTMAAEPFDMLGLPPRTIEASNVEKVMANYQSFDTVCFNGVCYPVASTPSYVSTVNTVPTSFNMGAAQTSSTRTVTTTTVETFEEVPLTNSYVLLDAAPLEEYVVFRRAGLFERIANNRAQRLQRRAAAACNRSTGFGMRVFFWR